VAKARKILIVILVAFLLTAACTSTQTAAPTPEPKQEPATAPVQESTADRKTQDQNKAEVKPDAQTSPAEEPVGQSVDGTLDTLSDETGQVPPPESSPETTSAFVIVDTGQIKCYDNTKIISCSQLGNAFYGQDAQYQGKQPVYQDNGDGTVTDLNTGLMWQKGTGDKMTWEEATLGSESFSLAGHTDWRMSSIKELYSLIIFTGLTGKTENDSTPYIDTDYFLFNYGNTDIGERFIDSQYISSTRYVGTTMDGNDTAFGVNFGDGRIKGYPLTNPRRQEGNKFYVRYVRGNDQYGKNNYADNKNGTIADSATGL